MDLRSASLLYHKPQFRWQHDTQASMTLSDAVSMWTHISNEVKSLLVKWIMSADDSICKYPGTYESTYDTYPDASMTSGAQWVSVTAWNSYTYPIIASWPPPSEIQRSDSCSCTQVTPSRSFIFACGLCKTWNIFFSVYSILPQVRLRRHKSDHEITVGSSLPCFISVLWRQ